MRGAVGESFGFRPGRVLAAGVAFLLLAAPLLAGNGKLEINQDCAQVGCFPGDTAGFPVQITAPGSYILTSSLSTSADGVSITAANTTLDLNGFEIAGTDAVLTTGIALTSGAEIKNGTVRDFFEGIQGQNLEGARLLDLRIISNVDAGIDCSPSCLGTLVKHVFAYLNGSNGISLSSPGSIVTNCLSIRNEGHGIFVGATGLVVGNTVTENTLDGVRAGEASAVIDNAVTGNGDHGIFLTGSTGLVKGNVATFNNNNDSMSENIEPCMGCVIIENEDSD